jgi:hypothetical protein
MVLESETVCCHLTRLASGRRAEVGDDAEGISDVTDQLAVVSGRRC